jgi:fumarate hydratase, class I
LLPISSATTHAIAAVGGVSLTAALKPSPGITPPGFVDLGMEAEFEVEEIPVTVAVNVFGNSIHATGPARWRKSGQA